MSCDDFQFDELNLLKFILIKMNLKKKIPIKLCFSPHFLKNQASSIWKLETKSKDIHKVDLRIFPKTPCLIKMEFGMSKKV